MIDVSIIIASYNSAMTLPAAIRSALDQQDVELEVLVCDDASTDNTAEVVSAIRDPRVKHLPRGDNGGPGAARNFGLAAARGEWCLVLDADDLISPCRARKLIDIGRREHADVVTDNMYITGGSGDRRLFIDENLDRSIVEIDLAGYFRSNIMFGKTPSLGYLKPVFRSPFLRKHSLRYDEHLRIGEDFAIVAEMLAHGARFVRSRSADYFYATHSGSISHRIRVSELKSMRDYDAAFLERHGPRLVALEREAVSHHLSSLETAIAYVEALDHLKAGMALSALGSALRRPGSIPLFTMPIKSRLAGLSSAARSQFQKAFWTA